jgi:hypothetical protein
MIRIAKISAAIILSTAWAQLGVAQDEVLRVTASVSAGEEVSIPTSGTGKATFYLVGPGIAQKRALALGDEIRVAGADLRTAGKYTAILCSETCHASDLFVSAAKPASLIFLVHPSRVPVAMGDAVSGVAFPFDQYQNLVLTSLNMNFQLSAKDGAAWSRSLRTQNGVAWFRTNSGKTAGLVQVLASSGNLSTRRALQQVASDPCNLRISGERNKIGIVVQTEPVHDCAGNVVPDGTIVTFTANGPHGQGTVDAPVKQGVARAEIQSPGASTVSVASGVVMGNEIHIGAQP